MDDYLAAESDDRWSLSLLQQGLEVASRDASGVGCFGDREKTRLSIVASHAQIVTLPPDHYNRSWSRRMRRQEALRCSLIILCLSR